MRLVKRVLVVLILAIGVVLFWSTLSRTSWAGTLEIVGESFEHPLEPMVEMTGALLVAVTGTKLIQQTFQLVRERILGLPPKRMNRAADGAVNVAKPRRDAEREVDRGLSDLGKQRELARFREQVLGLPASSRRM